MDSRPGTSPLVVIVGQTASGKSALAIDLAKQFDGEIICADSRTVYRGMDVGTAKPSARERAEVPHHLLDIVEPDEIFTAAAFKNLAAEAIENIASRDKLPILVGGSGLYIDALLFDYQFVAPPNPVERQYLEGLSVDQLQKEIRSRKLPFPLNKQNPRHLIRVLEIGGINQNKGSLRPNTLILGIQISRDTLRQRITERVDTMIQEGFVDEIKYLSAKYGWGAPALQTTGYRAFRPYLEDSYSLERAKFEFIKNDMDLAKRQRTWFKRNNSIQWLDNPSQAVDIVTTFLSKIHK